jgi:hypothetical protein
LRFFLKLPRYGITVYAPLDTVIVTDSSGHRVAILDIAGADPVRWVGPGGAAIAAAAAAAGVAGTGPTKPGTAVGGSRGGAAVVGAMRDLPGLLALINGQPHGTLVSRVFGFYAKLGNQFRHRDSFDVTKLENENLDQGEMNRLLKDLCLMPQWINQQQASLCFKACAGDNVGSIAGADMTRLVSIIEFRTLLVHMALTIFRPGAHPECSTPTDRDRVLSFLSLLHTGASQHKDFKSVAVVHATPAAGKSAIAAATGTKATGPGSKTNSSSMGGRLMTAPPGATRPGTRPGLSPAKPAVGARASSTAPPLLPPLPETSVAAAAAAAAPGGATADGALAAAAETEPPWALRTPVGVAVTRTGQIWVVDYGHHRVCLFS